MNQPVIHKATSSADLVALVEFAAGLRLRNCIAVMPFWQSRSNGAFRVALPSTVFDGPSAMAEVARGLASTALASLARFTGADGLALVVYADAAYPVADCALTPLIAELVDRFDDAGYRIKDAALVAGDGWSAFFDGKGERPLDEISVAARAFPSPPAERDHETLPTRDDALTRNVDEMLCDRWELDAECDSFGILRARPLPEPVAFVEQLLDRDPDSVGALDIARLIALLQSEGAVDRTVMQIAFGRLAGEEAWAATLGMRERAAAADVDPIDLTILDLEAGRLDPAVERRMARLSGQTDERPSPQRLQTALELLGRAVVNCTLPERSWAMCSLAWVRWGLGLATAADELLVTARRVDPLNTLAPSYHAMLGALQPNWLFRDRPPIRRSDRRAAARAARRDALADAFRGTR